MIYAIGDIHGMRVELEELLDQLPIGADDQLVFIGDYVDRGPDSKGVVDVLIDQRIPLPQRDDAEEILLHIWHLPGFYIALVAMLALEWYLRRRRGRA